MVILDGTDSERPGPLGKEVVGRHGADTRGGHRVEAAALCERSSLSVISPFRCGRYSVVSDLLTDLDRETKQALQSLYGVKDFPEDTAQKLREARSIRSTWEGPPPRFLNLIPLLVFNENEKRKAMDFFTGRKRKISGKIIHKASNVMHVHESKKLVGFQLVRPTLSQFICMGGGAEGGGAQSPFLIFIASRATVRFIPC